MRYISTGILGSLLHRQSLRRWEDLAETAKTAPLEGLREIRTAANALNQRTGTVINTANLRLARPVVGSNAMKLPPSTDWSFRPPLWRVPQSPSGYAPARNNTTFSGDVTLYHDCKANALSLRQVRNSGPDDLAPYGLQLDSYHFDGGFLSLVVRAPQDVVKDLKKTHILRVTTHIESERPISMTLRLNLKNGPNTEQVSKEIGDTSGRAITQFDMAYVPFNETRAEHLWFDLFFETPSMNAVRIRDLTFSRHRRADL